MPNKYKSKTPSLFAILNKILEIRTHEDVADKLNVTVGAVKRWCKTKNVPKQYTFELMELANLRINYSKFTFKEKDQFFTPAETGKYCYNKVLEILESYKDKCEYIYIEPSAGNGSFMESLPENKRIGLDIEPRNKEILKTNFLDWRPKTSGDFIVIGNPPFGLRGHLALKFINHSYKFAKYVCFILPQLFASDGKGVPRKRVKGYNLIHNEKLSVNFKDPGNKTIKIECVFQIWSKDHKNKRYDIRVVDTSDVNVYSLSDGGTPSSTRNKKMLYRCDVYLPSTCFGKENMRYYDNFQELPQKRGYGITFITNKQNFLKKFKKIAWSDVAFLSTNGAYNIRMSQIKKQLVKDNLP
jgi:hypothetical protein